MGHLGVNSEREYRLLQQRLDRNVTGAPDSPAFMKILRILFSPEDAALARRFPGRPMTLEALSQKLGIPQDELSDKITDMARRGLVLDVEHKGQRYAVLAPVIIGFFEFTFMRVRDELPIAELARLFEQYGTEDGRFVRSVFQGRTQLGRSLVREEALPEGDHTEILDWERASHLVKSATALAAGLCPCRHEKKHLGKACDKPLENCLSLNFGAESLVRNGIARPLTTDEAMRILAEAKDAGLAQTGDNVQRKAAFICNCCRCCCGMVRAIKEFDIRNAVATSNWIMEVDPAKCKGCGKCAKLCPLAAIHVNSLPKVSHPDSLPKVSHLREGIPGDRLTSESAPYPPEGVKPSGGGGVKPSGGGKVAVLDETLCLGCGVCYSACKFGAIAFKPRARRVLTPETMFDRMVAMAIERGKLADLLFDDPERLSHRALGRIVAVLEKSPPFKAAMAIRPLRSAFLNTIVKGAVQRAGELSEILT